MADVLFSYKLKTGQAEKDRKRLHIYGPEIAVWDRAVNVIRRKKNPGHCTSANISALLSSLDIPHELSVQCVVPSSSHSTGLVHF